MPRRKIPMSLIGLPKKLHESFKGRKGTLMAKAKQLSTLCDAKVAVVCADAGAVEVWESEEGVLDKYRALPPEVHAKHTHRRYLEGGLDTERAKLAKLRQDGALETWDDALNGITAEEARALLESIDAAMAAATARLEALGILDGGDGANDDGGLDLQHIPPGASHDLAPVGHGVQYIGSGSGGGNQQQMTLAAGDGIHNAHQYDILPWDDTFQAHNTDVMQPGCGFQCTGGHCVDMDGYMWQAPGDANAYHGWLDQAMWCTDGSCPCNAAAATSVPAMYPPTLDTAHGSFLAAPAQPLAFSTGADFINAPNDFLSVGVGGSFINVGDYSAQSTSDIFQLGDVNDLDQMLYLVGDTFGAEPGETQSQSWGSFLNVSDYSTQCSADAFQPLGDSIHLEQMHYLSGGTGGVEPSDMQSQNWGR